MSREHEDRRITEDRMEDAPIRIHTALPFDRVSQYEEAYPSGAVSTTPLSVPFESPARNSCLICCEIPRDFKCRPGRRKGRGKK